MVELRDRLYRALGYTTGGSVQPAPQVPSSTNITRTSTPHTLAQPQVMSVKQNFPNKQEIIFCTKMSFGNIFLS